MAVLAWYFVGACVLGVIALPLVVRRLGKSQRLMNASRIGTVRAMARADAAERAAGIAHEQHTQAARLAADAVATTRSALYVARQISKVSGQMDELMGYVTSDRAESPIQGRHAVPGDPEWYATTREFNPGFRP
jgi:hypothetical protein